MTSTVSISPIADPRFASSFEKEINAASSAFEGRFLVSLEQDLRKAVSAMDQMAVLLAQVDRDCK